MMHSAKRKAISPGLALMIGCVPGIPYRVSNLTMFVFLALALAIGVSEGRSEVDRFSDKRDTSGATNYRDFVLTSPDRKYVTNINEVILPNGVERVYGIAAFEGNPQGEYYRRVGPSYGLAGFKPTFGIGMNDGDSIIFDEYLRAYDYDTVLIHKRMGGVKTLASISDILPREELKRRFEKHGSGMRWLAAAEVQGNQLKLKLCDEDGSPAVPERVVMLDIERARPFVPYGQIPQSEK